MVLIQKKREKRMHQLAGPDRAKWEQAPQPLMTNIYKPPESTLAKCYSEQAIRFLFVIGELYTDIKLIIWALSLLFITSMTS